LTRKKARSAPRNQLCCITRVRTSRHCVGIAQRKFERRSVITKFRREIAGSSRTRTEFGSGCPVSNLFWYWTNPATPTKRINGYKKPRKREEREKNNKLAKKIKGKKGTFDFLVFLKKSKAKKA